jgi:ATP-binding cassette subfamily B protein
VLEAGDCFGEIALLRTVPRTATVRTLLPSVFLTIDRSEFDLLMERAPDLRTRLEDIAEKRTVTMGSFIANESALEPSAR